MIRALIPCVAEAQAPSGWIQMSRGQRTSFSLPDARQENRRKRFLCHCPWASHSCFFSSHAHAVGVVQLSVINMLFGAGRGLIMF